MLTRICPAVCLLLAISVLTLAGCSGNGTRGSSPTTLSPFSSTTVPNTSDSTNTATFAGAATPRTGATPTPALPYDKHKVTYKSIDGYTLTGCFYKPPGDGPFPLIVWNHGSGEALSANGPPHLSTAAEMERDFDGVAAVLVPAGFVVMVPERRGQGESQGPYIEDFLAQKRQTKGSEPLGQLLVEQMQGPRQERKIVAGR